MPAKGFLTDSQRQKLQNALKKSESPVLTQRILMLLLLNDGKTYQQISEFLGCSYRSVAHWCAHGAPDDLDSLRDKRKQGTYRKATEAYVEKLMETIKQSPQELGYEFGRWTKARLATYLEQETGIKLSGEQVRRILQRKKCIYLWSKYSLEDKQDRKKRLVFERWFKLEEELNKLLYRLLKHDELLIK